MALTRSTLLSLNALVALIATMILLPPAVRASNVANVTITTECTNCVGSQFAVYNDAVFLVAKGTDGGGAPTIDAINLNNHAVTNLMTGSVGSFWYVGDAAGRYVTFATIYNEFGSIYSFRGDLSDPANPVNLPGLDGWDFTAAKVDESGRVVGSQYFWHATPQGPFPGALKYEDATGSVVFLGYPAKNLAVHGSLDVVLFRSPTILDFSNFYSHAIENGGTALETYLGVPSGVTHVGSNVLDPITTLVTMDGVLGYIDGIWGTFHPLESGGNAVAVTDNYLFWNGAAGCTGHSTTLGTFELGSLAGASSLTGSTCLAAVEHDGKLFLALDSSGGVARFDVVTQAPALGPPGLVLLVFMLVATVMGFGARDLLYPSRSPGS